MSTIVPETTDQQHVLTDEDAAAYLAAGVNPRELVRLRWPDASDDMCDWILWERTPFPIVSGVHDIADEVAGLDPYRCGDLTDTGEGCRNRVRTEWTPCWRHRATAVGDV